MNRRLFFLKQDGWFETELTDGMLHAAYEDLIHWAYVLMERHHYRNYRIVEAPHAASALPEEKGSGKRACRADEFLIHPV